jgi:pilus assembly protein FimV
MRADSIFRLSVVATALALPGVAMALGLGKLTVQSSLGQPLSAQIELTSAQKDELDSLAAKIADSSLYRQNNLTYQGVLTRARVTLDRSGPQPVLMVTTSGAVNEPFLDLLVEMNWSAGRVVRAYTFLLDPPGIPQATAAVEPVTPVRPGAATTRAAAPAAAPQARTQAGDAYTVKRGDTLSKIATQHKPDAITLEQMLVAMFKSNASAFDGNNMNRLRSGAIMTIPSADDAAATTPGEASKVVRVQASDWRAYRDRVAAAAPSAEGAGARSAGGRIGTAVDEKAPAAVAGRDQLRVSPEAAQGRGAAGAAEEAVARDKQLREAQQRIADLEKTLKDLQRAVELKSPSMAQLQTQADAAKGKAEPPKAATPITTAPPVPAPAAKAPEPVPAAKAPEPALAPAKAPEPTKAPEPKAAEPAKAAEPPKAEAPVVEPPKAEPPKVEPPKAEPPKVEPPKPAPKAAAKAPPKAEPSFVDDLLSGTPSWALGAGALAILGGIAALVAARRRKTTKFEDSIISGTDIKTNTVFGSTGGGVVNTGDNSLASDFSREGLGNIDTDEVDPIAEAEVYLAYGRDAQAEEILKDALKKDAQRQEIYLKLLEIHAQHNKPSAFETVAAELYSVSQGQGEVWQKAVALGRQLDPNNPMFAEGAAGAAVAAAAATAAARETPAAAAEAASLPMPPELKPEQARPPVPDDVAPALGGDSGMDFKLDDEISISPSSGAKAKTPMEILAGAQSELEKTARASASSILSGADSAIDKAKTAANAGLMPSAPAPKPAVQPMDLDFRLDDDEKPAPMRPSAPQPEPALASAAAPALARPQAAIDLDKLDLSFDPEKSTFEDPTPSVLDGQWHDAATKLDLAKAYQEMGDVEGAREILQEVLHEGDDQQKVEAQALLTKLG